MVQVNKYQTKITDELLDSLPKEISDEFIDLVNNVEYIKRFISPIRKYAKDLQRDDKEKIIVDVCNPHILEDMEYFRPTGNYYRKYGVITKLRPNPNPNSDFGKWQLQEIDRIWHGMIRPSDGEWITGQMYFYLNYMPIIQSKVREGTKIADRIVDFPEVWDGVYLWFHYIDQARNGGIYNDFKGGQHGLQIAARGRSKAHPYSQHVYTPDGIKTWGSIKVGDLLFGDDGKTTKVIDIPFDDFTDIYKITTRDGRIVYASEDHLWKVYQHGFKEKYTIKSTKELLCNYKGTRKISDRNPNGVEFKYGIPINNSVEFSIQSTKVDPYTFGLLLGDGSFRGSGVNNVYFTSEESDMETYKTYIPYKIKKWNTKMGYGIEIDKFSTILKEYGLFFTKSDGKFIPDEYKFNSKEIRLELLKGLMDSDGYVGDTGIPTIGLSSKRMIDDIAFIARSLGYNCRYTKQKAGYKKEGVYIPCLDTYILSIFTNDKIFKLNRKNNKLTEFKSGYSRSNKIQSRIINIEYSHKEKAKCVTVDNESHCYLIGDFITTHNSYSTASILARLFVCGDNEFSNNKTIGIVTAQDKEKLIKDGTLNKFATCIDFCAEHTQFPSQRLKSSLSDMQWTMGYIDSSSNTNKGTENTTMGVAAGDDADKSRGKRANIFIYEEYGAFRKFMDIWNVNLPSVQEGI